MGGFDIYSESSKMLITKQKIKMKKVLIITNGAVSTFMPNILSGINLKENGIETRPYLSTKKKKFLDNFKFDKYQRIFVEEKSMESEAIKELLMKISEQKADTSVHALNGDPLNPLFLNEDEESVSFKEFIKNPLCQEKMAEVE